MEFHELVFFILAAALLFALFEVVRLYLEDRKPIDIVERDRILACFFVQILDMDTPLYGGEYEKDYLSGRVVFYSEPSTRMKEELLRHGVRWIPYRYRCFIISPYNETRGKIREALDLHRFLYEKGHRSSKQHDAFWKLYGHLYDD